MDHLRYLIFSFSLGFWRGTCLVFFDTMSEYIFSTILQVREEGKPDGLNNLSEECKKVEVRMFLLLFQNTTGTTVSISCQPLEGAELSSTACLSFCYYLQCWLIALSLTPSIPHCNCGLLPLYFCLLLVPFPLLLSFYRFLCVSADCELISSFERVMIPLCWDYVCVLHSVMAWLFIACRILIPQLKEWDDTCRELCASCSLTWKNGH